MLANFAAVIRRENVSFLIPDSVQGSLTKEAPDNLSLNTSNLWTRKTVLTDVNISILHSILISILDRTFRWPSRRTLGNSELCLLEKCEALTALIISWSKAKNIPQTQNLYFCCKYQAMQIIQSTQQNLQIHHSTTLYATPSHPLLPLLHLEFTQYLQLILLSIIPLPQARLHNLLN